MNRTRFDCDPTVTRFSSQPSPRTLATSLRQPARSLALLALTSLLAAQPRSASATEGDGNAARPALSVVAREEARRRFDQGLQLYNAGDLNGALAEFDRAYQMTGHPIVLYNVGLVHASLGHAAQAVHTLEQVLTRGSAELGTERTQRAEQIYQEQLQRVGSLVIKTDVAEATIQVDNVDVGKTPAPPLRVTAGSHLVAIAKANHEPQRLQVSVAGGAHEVLEIKLLPYTEALAHLKIASNVPDLDVRANGQLIARTPISGELTFKPGVYELELSRAGYVPARRRVTLGAGSRSALEVPMVPSDAGIEAGGSLSLAVSEKNAVVSVDGHPTLAYETGVQVPLGRHRLRVQRSGFFDVEREVVVRSGKARVDVTLVPTSTYLSAYVERTERLRTASYLTLGGGTVFALASGAFLFWNQTQKDQAKTKFDRAIEEVGTGKGSCTGACAERLEDLLEDLEAKRQRDAYGFVALGIGGAALLTGGLMLALGEDPRRYAPKADSNVFSQLELQIYRDSLVIRGKF